MATKPMPGADLAAWGTKLNGFLDESHNADGTLRTSAVEVAVADRLAQIRPDVTVSLAVAANSAAVNKLLIDTEIAARETAGGGDVYVPAGVVQTTGGHVVPRGVHIRGAGRFRTVIAHTGANVCFDLSQGAFDYGVALSGMEIIGNTSPSAKGIKIGNTHGTLIEDAAVLGYTTGEAVRIDNAGSPGFTEKVTLFNVIFQNNLVNIAFRKNGGLNSVVEAKFYGVTIVLNVANSIGVDIDEDLDLYGGLLDLKCNIEHATATVWRQTGTSRVHQNLYNIMAESSGGGTGLNLGSGTRFTGNGTIAFPSPITNQISSGATYGIGSVDNDHAFLAGSVVKSGAKVLAGDGDVTIANGVTSLPHGLYYVRFAGPSREHYLWFYASATAGGNTPTISVVGDYAFGGARVFGDPFFKRLSADGTNPHLIIPVSNRNGGTIVIAAAQFYGEQPQNVTILPAANAGALGSAEGVVQFAPRTSNTQPGIFLGGGRDTGFWKNATRLVETDSTVRHTMAAGTSAALQALATGDSALRYSFDINGRQEWGGGSGAQDAFQERAAAGILKSSRRATSVSGSAQAIATAGTVTLAAGVGSARLAPAGNVTGVIMPAGTVDGETVTLVNESAFTITFAAVGTSRVRDGVGCVIAANRGARFTWVAATTTWTRTD